MANRKRVKSETQSVVVGGRWLAYRLFPLGDGMGVVFRDITDRKRAEAQRDLLVGELHHRVNNTLATVQAIAAQTFRNAGVDAEVRKTFEARLLNLSNAQTALTQENWDSVELRELILSTLRPHGAPDPERFSIEGPDLRVQPKSAVALSMAIHELSTNAVKYGALSADGGRVAIAWEVKDGRFRLRWQEQGGPPVSPPTRKGFGSIMIERVLAEQLEGGVTIAYDPDGVVCTIDAPLDAVQDAASVGSVRPRRLCAASATPAMLEPSDSSIVSAPGRPMMDSPSGRPSMCAIGRRQLRQAGEAGDAQQAHRLVAVLDLDLVDGRAEQRRRARRGRQAEHVAGADAADPSAP